MAETEKEEKKRAKKTYSFTLENYQDVEAFAKARGLKNVPTLARFAINQYMSRSWKKDA
jgi:hypothetical protein